MDLRQRYQFDELKNIAEDLVIAEMDRQFTQNNLYTSLNQDAVLDIAALTLNLLKPLYRANLLGRVYKSAFEQEYHKEVAQAVTSSIKKILENP